MGEMRVASVTGAGSGIGWGCATKLADLGMAVVGTGRDETRLAALAQAVGDPDRVATFAVDLTRDEAPRRIVDLAVSRWGRVDFLINNAGSRATCCPTWPPGRRSSTSRRPSR